MQIQRCSSIPQVQIQRCAASLKTILAIMTLRAVVAASWGTRSLQIQQHMQHNMVMQMQRHRRDVTMMTMTRGRMEIRHEPGDH